jgi:hypothetical protein
MLLEIAERFATAPAPARSIIFISHASEEGGLNGSRHFTDNPTVPLDSIVAAHNMDMVGKGRVTDVRFGGPAQVQMLGARRLSAEFGDVIDSLNAVREETMAIDYSWDRTNALNRFCRSDQVNYFRHTIPVTYFSTGYSVDYHMATDEPQYIDYDKSARVGRFVHEIMLTDRRSAGAAARSCRWRSGISARSAGADRVVDRYAPPRGRTLELCRSTRSADRVVGASREWRAVARPAATGATAGRTPTTSPSRSTCPSTRWQSMQRCTRCRARNAPTHSASANRHHSCRLVGLSIGRQTELLVDLLGRNEALFAAFDSRH